MVSHMLVTRCSAPIATAARCGGRQSILGMAPVGVVSEEDELVFLLVGTVTSVTGGLPPRNANVRPLGGARPPPAPVQAGML